MKKFTLLLILSVLTIAGGYNKMMLDIIKYGDHNQTRFSFAVMGDNRDGDPVLKKIIRTINEDENISFAINNGDLVPDGYDKEFRKYLQIIESSKQPILSIIGNHEIPWYDGEHNYKNFFGKSYFDFHYGNSYFIVLDSSDKSIDAQQKKWLIEALKRSQAYTHRFVVTHVPLYDPREGTYQKGHSFHSLKEAAELNALFDRYKVTMLFASHIHFYYRGKWHRTTFIITGGAGAPLKHFEGHGFYNFVKVTVDGAKVRYRVVRIKAKSPGFFQRLMQYTYDVLGLE